MISMDKYQKIYNEFVNWILGIEEDDPLDPEIRFIIFSLNTKNEVNSISYAGCENKQKIVCSFDYFPLEAQFFYDSNVFNLNKEDIAQVFKVLVKDILDNQDIYNLFNGRSVITAINGCVFGDVIKVN